MHITIDRDTLPNEMHHIAIALQRIAAENGYRAEVEASSSASQTITVGEMSVTLNATSAVEALADLKIEDVPPVTVSTITEEFKKMPEPGSFPLGASAVIEPPVTVTIREPGVVHSVNINATIDPATDTNLDINGLPWDARIHAGSRERNTDGSWRVRRRPKGVEEADWDATLARVTAELTDLMAIPVSPGAVADAAAEEALTDADVDTFVGIMEGITGEPVVVAPPVTIAPPVVIPPVTAVAPPITVDKPAIETFAQLMSWLTSRTPKDEAAKPAMVTRVNEILAANGLTTLQQLGQRADLIPQVLVQFREAFGE
jgi:hypothetical protein